MVRKGKGPGDSILGTYLGVAYSVKLRNRFKRVLLFHVTSTDRVFFGVVKEPNQETGAALLPPLQ